MVRISSPAEYLLNTVIIGNPTAPLKPSVIIVLKCFANPAVSSATLRPSRYFAYIAVLPKRTNPIVARLPNPPRTNPKINSRLTPSASNNLPVLTNEMPCDSCTVNIPVFIEVMPNSTPFNRL